MNWLVISSTISANLVKETIMEKFNGTDLVLCEEEHDLKVIYDNSDKSFFAYCNKCALVINMSAKYLDKLFKN